MHEEQDPDPAWVEELSRQGPEASERAILEAQRETRLFSHLEKEHAREGRVSYVEIDAPLELHALVRLLQPLHIVEVGVSSGVSSAYLLNALEKNGAGTLHSVDRPSSPRRSSASHKRMQVSWSLPPGRSSGWAVPFHLRKRWDLRLGDKELVLPLLARELPRIDMLLYDVPHEEGAAWKEFRTLDPLFPPGGVAIVDHGPGGELCAALRRWAHHRGGRPIRCAQWGLYGMRLPTPTPATLQTVSDRNQRPALMTAQLSVARPGAIPR
jgi:Methyltransferase domain